MFDRSIIADIKSISAPLAGVLVDAVMYCTTRHSQANYRLAAMQRVRFYLLLWFVASSNKQAAIDNLCSALELAVTNLLRLLLTSVTPS